MAPSRTYLVSFPEHFRADTATLMGIKLNSYVASRTTEIRGHNQLCLAVVDVLGQSQEQLTQTFFVLLHKKHILTMILDCKKADIIELS